MEFTEYQVGGRYYAITAISEVWESSEIIGYYVDVLAPGEISHSGPGEKSQFQPDKNSQRPRLAC